MKIVKILIFSVALIITAEGCAQKKAAPEGITRAQVDSLSYAIGVMMGENFKQSQLEFIDPEIFAKALTDAFNDASKFDVMTAQNYIQAFMMKDQERRNAEEFAKAAKNAEEGEKFLSENKSKEGVQVTESGLQYKIVSPGSDVKPMEEDVVEVNYRGTTIDGKEFDSSYKRNETAKFPLMNVISGWTEGIQLIGEGGKIMLYIPSDLAYGPNAPAEIGPNSTLIFEVELIKVNPE